jgi:EpsD family peptidyl-prolyl cis-trans isomerase
MRGFVLGLDVRKSVTVAAAAAAALVLTLSACGGGKDEKRAAGQTVARVNKEELTVHQINFLLAQQRGLKPEQMDAASRQVLERLIDQELAIQKAADQKLDRDARVVAQIEAARREIISRAYFERVGDGASRPAAEEIKKYYDDNPALFADRKIFQLQELAIEAPADKVPALRDSLKSAKNFNDFVQVLKAGNVKFSGNQVVRGAEQVPMNLLATLSTAPAGASVLLLVSTRPQPVELTAAKGAIEQFLINDRKRKLVADDLKAMRAAAQITYLGKFADAPKGAPALAPAPTAADVAASAAAPLGDAAAKVEPPAPQPAARAAAPAASALDASTISKGLGLK